MINDDEVNKYRKAKNSLLKNSYVGISFDKNLTLHIK